MKKAPNMGGLVTNLPMLEAFMYEFINCAQFAQYLFDREGQAEKGGAILQAMLEARSPRLSDISQKLAGKPSANYKAIQRFLNKADPQTVLMMMAYALGFGRRSHSGPPVVCARRNPSRSLQGQR